MSRAVIIQGTSGSGKSTLARRLAIKNQAVWLEHDYFLFSVQPYRPETREHFELGNSHMWCCFKNAVAAKKDIVIDGVLVSHDTSVNNFCLSDYLSCLEENQYDIKQFMLISTYEVAKERMAPRATNNTHVSVVEKDLYEKLRAALDQSVPDSVPVFDTSQTSIEELEAKIDL